MIISRLSLRRDAGALGALTDLLRDGLDAGRAHRLLWTLFGGDGAPRPRDFVFRAGAGPQTPEGDFLVVSRHGPDDRLGLWLVESKPYDPQVCAGQRLSFRLRANPTITRDGKRHDVVMDMKRRLGAPRSVREAEIWEQSGRSWLNARAELLGVEIAGCRADGYRVHRLARSEAGKRISVAMLDLSGRLVVRDPERLRRALFTGVGHSKAWGCGLLLVKPG